MISAMTAKILVIDDEKLIRWTMNDVLQREGYHVITAECGETGLQLVEGERPDLILLDLRLPGMDDMEVLDRVKQIEPNVVVIIVTAHGTAESAVEAMKKAYFTGDNASPPSTNLCFDCHVAAQYLTDTEASETTYTHFRDGRDASSKNRHYFHVVEQQTSCKTCHFNIHGATTAHLVNFNPAVVSPEGGQLRYDHLPDGGECTLSCHGRKHDPSDYRWR